ncbi:MAG: SprT-like domain-containing protein [Butyricicoccus sp.]|nr:SprT-like domain-containing protein [Butyricicoccus sp.]MCM1236545.1 SprT-like domain-containing protein [Ruminococcus flavefaciens]
MKETVKTSRTAGYLEKIFRVLNAHYFDGELEEPVITIQSTPRAYGHVTVAKSWSRADGEKRHELNIGAGTLDRPIENVVSTLLHECCHLYNLQRGIQDCSRGGTYHNKRFKQTAESRDLIISYDSRIGWSVTEPSDALIEFIISQGWEDIHMSRNDGYTARGIGKGAGASGGNTAPTVTPKPSSTRKLICPCCGQSVRATRAVNIICGDCFLPMVQV